MSEREQHCVWEKGERERKKEKEKERERCEKGEIISVCP
jgi:hypothetical protein